MHLPSASACFRQLPPSSVGCRFGSLLVLASVGDIFSLPGDDGGRPYLEPQHALGQICGRNMPNLMMLRQFPSCLQLPFRSLLILASDGDVLARPGDDGGGSYLEIQHAMRQICGEIRRF